MRFVKKDEILVSEGDESKVIFILMKGELGVYKSDSLISNFKERGTIVGEMSMILNTPRTATIKALKDTYVIEVVGDLESVISNFPEVTKTLLSNLAERLMKTTQNFWLISERLSENDTKKSELSSKTAGGKMKTYSDYIWFKTAEEREYIDITKNLNTMISQSRVDEGILTIVSLDNNSGVFINKYKDELLKDLDFLIEKNLPMNERYRYKDEDMILNGSHLKNRFVSENITIPITSGKIEIGIDNSVIFAEFDGKKKKKLIVKIVGI